VYFKNRSQVPYSFVHFKILAALLAALWQPVPVIRGFCQSIPYFNTTYLKFQALAASQPAFARLCAE